MFVSAAAFAHGHVCWPAAAHGLEGSALSILDLGRKRGGLVVSWKGKEGYGGQASGVVLEVVSCRAGNTKDIKRGSVGGTVVQYVLVRPVLVSSQAVVRNGDDCCAVSSWLKIWRMRG